LDYAVQLGLHFGDLRVNGGYQSYLALHDWLHDYLLME
jgi:hypothetical protein